MLSRYYCVRRFLSERAALALLLCCALTAHAAAPRSDGKALYGPCVVCHQPGAQGSPDGHIPSLAGQQSSYLAEQLALFHSGARADTAMQLVTAHSAFNGQQNMLEISDYLASLDPNSTPVKGSGEHLRVGQETYSHLCASCHGIDGRGDARGRVPRLAGQHYPYLRRQIEQVASVHRKSVPRNMGVVLGNLYGDQKDAVADYLSRLDESAASLDLNR